MDTNDEKSLPPANRMLAFARGHKAMVAIFAGAVVAVAYLVRDDPSHPPLPDYSIVSIVSSREAPAKLELAAGDEAFELVLRPAMRVETKVALYVFAIAEGEPNPVEAKVELTPDGPIRITGRVRALAGAREVRVVIGAASEFKRYEDALARARDGKSDGPVRVLVVPVVRARSAVP